MNSQYDGDKRIFSLYLAEVMQTLDPIQALHVQSWVTEDRPEVIDDVPDDIARLYDITVDDYRQFALQVIEYEKSLEEDDELQQWIASE